MSKLINTVSNVLNITFNEKGYASRDGVAFRLNNYKGSRDVLVMSTKYENVFGKIYDGMTTTQMKDVANNMADIDTLGKYIKDVINNANLTPFGNWNVGYNRVRTVVIKDGKQVALTVFLDGTIRLDEINYTAKKALPKLRPVKEDVVVFDRDRFNKYLILVAGFRPTYKELAKLVDIPNLITNGFDLDNPLLTLTMIVEQARLMNKRKYKSTAEQEAKLIIKRVEKMKGESK